MKIRLISLENSGLSKNEISSKTKVIYDEINRMLLNYNHYSITVMDKYRGSKMLYILYFSVPVSDGVSSQSSNVIHQNTASSSNLHVVPLSDLDILNIKQTGKHDLNNERNKLKKPLLRILTILKT